MLHATHVRRFQLLVWHSLTEGEVLTKFRTPEGPVVGIDRIPRNTTCESKGGDVFVSVEVVSYGLVELSRFVSTSYCLCL
jgi:hypothetical protein